MGFFDSIKQSLTRTKQQFVERFDDVVRRADDARAAQPADRRRDDRGARRGADLRRRRRRRDRAHRRRRPVARPRAAQSLRELVKAEILRDPSRAPTCRPANGHRPHVVLIVGVNGTGKTTTVGKLARLIKDARPDAAHLRRRHVSRRGGRAARDLGDPRRRRLHPRAGGRRSGGRRVRRDRGRQGARAATSCSSTPPAGSTRAST